MAFIIYDRSTCPLCGKVLRQEDDILGITSYSLMDPRIRMLDDSGFHRSCFEQWEHRELLVKRIGYDPLTHDPGHRLLL